MTKDAEIKVKTSADLAALLTTGKGFATLTAQEQAAEKQALSLAQSMARLDASLKQPAAGALRLRAALADAAYIDPSQGVAALNQIIALEQKAEKEADNLAKKNKGLGPALPRTIDGLSGSAAQVAKGFLSIQAAEKGIDFLRIGAQAADARQSLDKLAIQSHTTGAVLVNSLRDAAQGTIRDSVLIQSANKGIELTQGRITQSLPQLIQIARAAAKSTGDDIGGLFDSLVKGIARGSPKLIDNANIVISESEAYGTFAKSIGKATDQLTDQEKQLATQQAVLAKGAELVKTIGLDANSSAAQIDRATVAVQNLGTAISTKIAPTAGRIAEGVTNIINKGDPSPGATAEKDATQAKLISQATSFDDYAKRLAAANDQLGAALANNPVDAWLDKQFLGLQQVTPAQFAYAQSLIASGASSDVALQKAQGLADVDGFLTKALNSATTAALGYRAELTDLAPKIFEVANQSDHNKTSVEGLLTAYAQGRESLPGLIEALDALSKGHDIARLAAQEEERENRRLGQSFTDLVPQVDAAKVRLKAGLSALRSGSVVTANELSDTHTQVLLDAASQREADAKRAADKAAQLDQVNFDNRLKRAKDNAAKIKLLQAREASTADPVERARLEGQIIDLQQQKNTGLSRELGLQESIYDAQQKRLSSALSLREAEIRDRQQDRDDIQKVKTADAILRATAGKTDARSIDFANRARDDKELISIQDQQRALDIAQKGATAGASIVNGKLLQSVPGGVGAPPVGAPAVGNAPANAPIFSTAPIAAQPIIVQLVVDGKTLAATTEPYIWDSLMKAVRTESARSGH